jgi:photosystem II stability/assembly factor-like uncharacterized protein
LTNRRSNIGIKRGDFGRRNHYNSRQSHLFYYSRTAEVSHLKFIGTAIFLTLLFCINAFAQGGWFLRESDIEQDLVAAFFTSSDRGWIAGDGGFLMSTNDGGRTWNRTSLNTQDDINEIYFRNKDNGYLVAGRTLYVTDNGGRTWQDIRIYRTGEFGSGRPEFLSIRFADKRKGFVVGSVLVKRGNDDIVVESLMMRTEDGGGTWSRVALPVRTELIHLDFVSGSRGWVVGEGGVILATTDEGRTWTRQESGTQNTLYNVDFRDDKEGYAVGENGTILRTSNGGRNWERAATNFTETFTRVDFTDDKNGWVVGHNGLILRSSDRGRTWARQESNIRNSLYGLYMDKKFGWAVGAKGTLIQFRR